MRDWLKRWGMVILAVINAGEGFSHFLFAGLGIWGCYATDVWDWRVVSPIAENLAFGILSILTGIILGKGFHHYH